MSNLLETVVGKQRKQHSEKGMLNRKRCNLFLTQKNEDEFHTNLNLRTIHSTITVKLTPPFIYSPRNVLTVLCVFLSRGRYQPFASQTSITKFYIDHIYMPLLELVSQFAFAYISIFI